MSKLKTAISLLKTNKTVFILRLAEWLAQKKITHLVPDKLFLKCQYRAYLGKKLDLKNPKGFNEKLQWIKLYDRNPTYCNMVDKYESKKVVAQKLGEEYIIPTLGVWDHFEEIDFDSLPEQFVLKCTHDSGSIVICRNRETFDVEAARMKLQQKLKKNLFWHAREWPYKNVKPRILAEQYMEDTEAKELVDYKFYCFGGQPRFLYVSSGLANHTTATMSFLTLDWQFAPYERSDYKPLKELPKKPVNFDQMVEFAKILSEGIDFLRVDLYEINDKVYFSELTFSPAAGFMPFKNPEHDIEVGQMLKLSEKK